MERTLLWPDTHVPDHNKRAVASLLELTSRQKFDRIVLLGDFWDMKPVARWSKDTAAEVGEDMQREVEVGKALLAEIRQAHGKRPIDLLIGNHEIRWQNYLTKYAPGVFGMDALRFETVFGTDDYDIVVRPQPYRLYSDIIGIHGTRLGPRAGMSAYKELDRHGISVFQGHSHRLGLTWHTKDKRRFALECGWLGDVKKASYLDYGVADWSMGFGVLSAEGSLRVPSIVPVEPNGSFLFEGRKYG